MWVATKILHSTDNNVAKYVFTKNDAVAESVLYRYPTYDKRTVICCSTQSGCPIGCRFCGAGDNFVRSLTADEIISQPVRLLEDTGVNPTMIEKLQIMFMSMGEPMLNMQNLIKAICQLYIKYPNAALLVSTSGPKVDYEPFLITSKEIPTVGLQFSVHESTDERRNKLIPFKSKMTLAEIAAVGERWAGRTYRQPFFNYCATPDNTSDEDADRLVKLFKPHLWQATISVVCERGEHVAAANERQRELAADFMAKLSERGYSTRMFNPAGQDDIGGGCGQLFHVQNWMKQNPDKIKPSVGHGLPIVHMPT